MNPIKWSQFSRDIIFLNVRWYLAYPHSYRNLEEMMNDRGLSVDHATIYQKLPLQHALEGMTNNP